MSERDFATVEAESFARRVSVDDDRMMYKLVEYLGFATGEKLGTDSAAQIIHHAQGWFYDREFGVVLACPVYHNQVASHLYACHLRKEWDYRDAEKYAEEGYGFWKSSVSSRHIYIGSNPIASLTAQEKLVFRSYVFEKT